MRQLHNFFFLNPWICLFLEVSKVGLAWREPKTMQNSSVWLVRTSLPFLSSHSYENPTKNLTPESSKFNCDRSPSHTTNKIELPLSFDNLYPSWDSKANKIFIQQPNTLGRQQRSKEYGNIQLQDTSRHPFLGHRLDVLKLRYGVSIATSVNTLVYGSKY